MLMALIRTFICTIFILELSYAYSPLSLYAERSRWVSLLSASSDASAAFTDEKSSPPLRVAFNRTDRVEGRLRLQRELRLLAEEEEEEAAGDSLLSLAKELLYSNVPEQVLELYAAYFDALTEKESALAVTVNCAVSNTSVPVIVDPKLILVVIKALTSLGEVDLVLTFLNAVAAANVLLDSVSKSAILFELAVTSPLGLQAALKVRESLLLKQEKVNQNGYSGLLRGLRSHGLQSSPQLSSQSKLLLPNPSEVDETIHPVDDYTFRILPGAAEKLVVEFLESCVSPKRPLSSKLMVEALRVVFRASAMQSKEVLDANFEVDIMRTNALRADAGLTSAVAMMKRFKVEWDIHIFDCLLEECIELGDLGGVKFIVRQMKAKRLYARTSTFNTILKVYAAGGDAESALSWLQTMKSSPFTLPNKESYRLVLSSCTLSKKGMFLAPEVIKEMLSSGAMDKESWDCFLGYSVLAGVSWQEVLRAMTLSGVQPDEKSILKILEQFGSLGRLEDAIQLFQAQRQKFTRAAMKGLSLPPPSRRTVVFLLELLRGTGNVKDALFVLKAVCSDARSAASSSSGGSFLASFLKPDVAIFALVMETCVLKDEIESAFAVFSELEKLRIAPDRRIYSMLIRAFGSRGDIYSSVGVFYELMATFKYPDVSALESLLSTAAKNPTDLRLCVPLLENLSDKGFDLSVFSKDVLIQSFGDARQLGKALEMMRAQEVPEGCQIIGAGLEVLSALTQALRRSEGISEILNAMQLLGRAGVFPDKTTMEYFSIPDAPAANSPGSSHFSNKLMPNQIKMRSLMQMDVPEALAQDVSAPKSLKAQFSYPKIPEPYFTLGDDRWMPFTDALVQVAHDRIDEPLNDDDADERMVVDDMVKVILGTVVVKELAVTEPKIKGPKTERRRKSKSGKGRDSDKVSSLKSKKVKADAPI